MAHSAANSAVIYDSTSDAGESDASTCEEGPNSMGRLSIMARVRSLQQENTVLKIEVDTLKLRCKNLKEENEELRRARVNLQARAEQEEEYISNTLLRKIQSLKKEKEVLATTYEQEEEYLTNDLSRKLAKLREEKMQLENTLEVEQQNQIGRLMKKIEKLEHETSKKQAALEQLRRDKVDLENYLEQEQEQLVNKLWKQMDDLEKQKQDLITQLSDQSPPKSNPSAAVVGEVEDKSRDSVSYHETCSEQSSAANGQAHEDQSDADGDDASGLSDKVDDLRSEVSRLKKQLKSCQIEHAKRLKEVTKEEDALRAEKLLLERKLAREKERSDALNKQLSESESSLEIDDERHFNESRKSASSPIPVVPGSPLHHRSISGGLNIQVGSPVTGASMVANKCIMCGTHFPAGSLPPSAAAPGGPISAGTAASFSSLHHHSTGGHMGSNANTPAATTGIGGAHAGCSGSHGLFFPPGVGAGLPSPNANSFTPYGAAATQQRSRLVSGSSTTSQKSPRGSFLNESSG
ncbi:coiled-coil domain-containing protein 6-like [Symsagittifera roscoffensis]|uniref:coiled-coil domain-containing protein 6-like n=1 Tax=Symsagittifera roscoffensis TaxID=84072 RepID=UPI00307CBACC